VRFFLLGVSEETSTAVASGAVVGKLVKLACDILPIKVLACSSAELTAHIAVMGSFADSTSSIAISESSSMQRNIAEMCLIKDQIANNEYDQSCSVERAGVEE
jgi:hypothetical protein